MNNLDVLADVATTSAATAANDRTEQTSPPMPMPASVPLSLRLVTTMLPNDVLMGRGVPISRFSGNIRFRKVIASFKDAYMSTSRHKVKHQTAKKVYNILMKQEVRFLREIEPAERQALGLLRQEKVWALVTDIKAIMDKIKQALREFKSTNAKKNKSSRRNGDQDSERPESEHGTATDATPPLASALNVPHVVTEGVTESAHKDAPLYTSVTVRELAVAVPPTNTNLMTGITAVGTKGGGTHGQTTASSSAFTFPSVAFPHSFSPLSCFGGAIPQGLLSSTGTSTRSGSGSGSCSGSGSGALWKVIPTGANPWTGMAAAASGGVFTLAPMAAFQPSLNPLPCLGNVVPQGLLSTTGTPYGISGSSGGALLPALSAGGATHQTTNMTIPSCPPLGGSIPFGLPESLFAQHVAGFQHSQPMRLLNPAGVFTGENRPFLLPTHPMVYTKTVPPPTVAFSGTPWFQPRLSMTPSGSAAIGDTLPARLPYPLQNPHATMLTGNSQI